LWWPPVAKIPSPSVAESTFGAAVSTVILFGIRIVRRAFVSLTRGWYFASCASAPASVRPFQGKVARPFCLLTEDARVATRSPVVVTIVTVTVSARRSLKLISAFAVAQPQTGENTLVTRVA